MPKPGRSVRIVLFASAREAVGAAALERAVPERGVSVETLLRELAREYPPLAPILRASRFVRNGEYVVGRRGRVRRGDEFAIHPPYGGG